VKFLFEVTDFNSLDHFVPVAAEALKQDHFVTFLFKDCSVDATDARVKYLNWFERFETLQLDDLKARSVDPVFTFISRLFFGRLFSRCGFLDARLKLLVKVSKLLFLYRGLRHIEFDCAISGWGDPSSFAMTLALSRRKPIVALPHGYPCLKNSVFNKEIARILEETGSLPNFSLRNNFDCYVVATERNRSQLVSWNVQPEKVEVWGNARFSPNWVETLLTFLPKFSDSRLGGHQQVVLFLLPAPTSNFKHAALRSLLIKLARLPIILVLKTHTRMSSQIDIIPAEIMTLQNVVLASETSTTRLIQSSHTVVNFATGTAIDALHIGRRLIFAKYLSDNAYSWEDCPSIKTASCEEECLSLVVDTSWNLEPSLHRSYLDQEVFAEGRVQNPPLHYATRLIEIATAGRS